MLQDTAVRVFSPTPSFITDLLGYGFKQIEGEGEDVHFNLQGEFIRTNNGINRAYTIDLDQISASTLAKRISLNKKKEKE